MVRKQVYIAPQQQKLLNKLTRTSGKSEAQIIRDAIDEYDRLQDRRAAWQETLADIKDSMKPVKARTPAGRTWKREDLYDRDKRSVGYKRPRVSP